MIKKIYNFNDIVYKSFENDVKIPNNMPDSFNLEYLLANKTPNPLQYINRTEYTCDNNKKYYIRNHPRFREISNFVFTNVTLSSLPYGTFNYIICKNTINDEFNIIYGMVTVNSELGVKHSILSKGFPVYLAGELKKKRNQENIKDIFTYNLNSSNFNIIEFIKRLLTLLNNELPILEGERKKIQKEYNEKKEKKIKLTNDLYGGSNKRKQDDLDNNEVNLETEIKKLKEEFIEYDERIFNYKKIIKYLKLLNNVPPIENKLREKFKEKYVQMYRTYIKSFADSIFMKISGYDNDNLFRLDYVDSYQDLFNLVKDNKYYVGLHSYYRDINKQCYDNNIISEINNKGINNNIAFHCILESNEDCLNNSIDISVIDELIFQLFYQITLLDKSFISWDNLYNKNIITVKQRILEAYNSVHGLNTITKPIFLFDQNILKNWFCNYIYRNNFTLLSNYFCDISICKIFSLVNIDIINSFLFGRLIIYYYFRLILPCELDKCKVYICNDVDDFKTYKISYQNTYNVIINNKYKIDFDLSGMYYSNNDHNYIIYILNQLNTINTPTQVTIDINIDLSQNILPLDNLMFKKKYLKYKKKYLKYKEKLN